MTREGWGGMTLAAAILLGGCTAPALDMIDGVLGTDLSTAAIQATANSVDRHCGLVGGNIPARRETVERINAATVIGDVTALDCDSDGEPDF